MTMLQNKKVLIIDDDPDLSYILSLTFAREGMQPILAENGRAGLRAFRSLQPDLVILDIMMPEMDGWEVCRRIRSLADTPIIMLTTLSRDRDVIRGLEYGADDFVSKPMSPKVMVARAKATLRRVSKAEAVEASDNILGPRCYIDDYLTVNCDERRAYVKGQPVKLTATEFRLLAFMLENAGCVLTYQQILDNVWGWEYRDSIDYVHVYTSHLRRKLEENPREPRYLHTEHGIGYRFVGRV
jgi:two-component system, OmpR family, KDP operon response regulator KdpE